MNALEHNVSKMPSLAILAGGLATRLRPLTDRIPKSLLPIAGEPFIAHQLRLLAREGIDEVVILCGFLGEQIKMFVGDGFKFGCNVRYVFDGETPLGTGGALRNALPMLGDRFMVIYGDSYCPTNYRKVYKAFVASDKLGMMTVLKNNNKWDCSNVEFNGSEIVCYDKDHRTDRMHHIDYGIGVFNRDAFLRRQVGEPFDLSAVQKELLSEGELAGLEVKERFYEIGSHAGLEETARMLNSQHS